MARRIHRGPEPVTRSTGALTRAADGASGARVTRVPGLARRQAPGNRIWHKKVLLDTL